MEDHRMPFDTLSNWKAVTGPLLDQNGNEVPGDIVRGVYRDDTGEVIGSCGKNFKPVQHSDVSDPVLQTLKDDGVEIIERTPTKNDLYDLKGQKGAFLDIQEAHNGAVLRFDVITGDFTNPTGPSAFLPDGPPTLFRRYTGLNSHNSTYAAQAVASYVNLRCLNGMVNEQFSAAIKGKHTKHFDTTAFKAKILAAADLMQGDTERFERYIRTPCSLEQAEAFFKKTIAWQRPDAKGNEQWSESLVKQLLELFAEEGTRNVWAVYQALTAWATHGTLKGNAVALTARVGRDERVARALRAPQFKELVAA
jgi:hypothetical protein